MVMVMKTMVIMMMTIVAIVMVMLTMGSLKLCFLSEADYK